MPAKPAAPAKHIVPAIDGMQAISVQQPWAYFLARGILRLLPRLGTTSRTGRIVLHASSDIALKEVDRLWNSNARIARRFAEQGFVNRADIKALPRGAIIGTIELVGVDAASDVHAGRGTHVMESGFARALDTAVRSRRTGEKRPLIIRAKTLPLHVPADRNVWAFKGAVEFEPIFGVEGRQNLWYLTPALERQVAEAEAWSTRHDWRPPAVPRDQLQRAMAAFRERWSASVKTKTRDIVSTVMQEISIELLTLEDPKAEAWFQDIMNVFLKHSRERDGNVNIPSALRSVFGGRKSVPPLLFELTCRRQLHAQLARMKQDLLNAEFEKEVSAFHAMLLSQAEKRGISNAEVVRRVREHCRKTFFKQQAELNVEIEWVEREAWREDGFDDDDLSEWG